MSGAAVLQEISSRTTTFTISLTTVSCWAVCDCATSAFRPRKFRIPRFRPTCVRIVA